MTDWANILEEDLRWREAELASLKRLAINSSDNPVTYSATLRASWALLYAHFEGFTKYCWEILLDQVQEKKVPVESLEDKYLLLALEKDFRVLRKNLSGEALWQFFSIELPNLLKKDAIFDDDCRPDADSNLWPNVFERECARVGITSDELNSQRHRIKTLVARRNDIAHGKVMTIKSVEEYSQYEKATTMVMHDVAISVLSVLSEGSYKKP